MAAMFAGAGDKQRIPRDMRATLGVPHKKRTKHSMASRT